MWFKSVRCLTTFLPSTNEFFAHQKNSEENEAEPDVVLHGLPRTEPNSVPVPLERDPTQPGGNDMQIDVDAASSIECCGRECNPNTSKHIEQPSELLDPTQKDAADCDALIPTSLFKTRILMTVLNKPMTTFLLKKSLMNYNKYLMAPK